MNCSHFVFAAPTVGEIPAASGLSAPSAKIFQSQRPSPFRVTSTVKGPAEPRMRSAVIFDQDTTRSP